MMALTLYRESKVPKFMRPLEYEHLERTQGLATVNAYHHHSPPMEVALHLVFSKTESRERMNHHIKYYLKNIWRGQQ